MNLVAIIMLVLKASIALTVLGFALNATWADATFMFRHPGKWARAVLSMNVVMFVLTVLLVKYFDLHIAVKIVLVALSLSPVPPFLPVKALKSGGSMSYMIGLLTAAALLAIVLVPLALELLQRIFDMPMGITPWAVAPVMLISILAPLGLGILVRALAPAFADRIARPVSLIAAVLLVVCSLPLLIALAPMVWSLTGNGTIIVLVVFVVVGLASGHVLGAPDPHERMVLAFSTAARHPGVALTIAHANFPDQNKLTTAAVVLFLLISIIGSIPYTKLVRQRVQPSG